MLRFFSSESLGAVMVQSSLNRQGMFEDRSLRNPTQKRVERHRSSSHTESATTQPLPDLRIPSQGQALQEMIAIQEYPKMKNKEVPPPSLGEGVSDCSPTGLRESQRGTWHHEPRVQRSQSHDAHHLGGGLQRTGIQESSQIIP